jgi:hypothetical protein
MKPRQESIGLAAINSGSSNPFGMGMYQSWGMRKRTILQMGVIPRYVHTLSYFMTAVNGKVGFKLVHRQVQDNERTCAAVYGHGTRVSL